MKPLTTALEALGRGDRAAALAQVVEAWRTKRHPRIAALVDRISDELTAERGPLAGATRAARVETFTRLAAAQDPAELGRLLAFDWPFSWQSGLPQLEALARWPDDPRLAQALAREVEAARYFTLSAAGFYRPLFARLDSLLDVRALPLLRAKLARDSPHFAPEYLRLLEEEAVRRLTDFTPPALTTGEERLLDALERPWAAVAQAEAKAEKSEQEYLAAVDAEPGDLVSRAVYADWLTEQGDPRGEFISLQLARRERAPSLKALVRERWLWRRHYRTWLGELRHALKEPNFEAGFPSSGRLELRGTTLAEVLAHPGWGTVEALELPSGDRADPLAIARHPALRSLRRLVGVTGGRVAELCAAPPTRLTGLGLRGSERDDSPLPLEELGLRWLGFGHARGVARAAAALGRLESATVLIRESDRPGAAISRLEAAGVPEVELKHGWFHPARYRLRRERPGAPFTSLDAVELADWRAPAWLLPELPATLRSVVLRSATAHFTSKTREAIDEALARFTTLDHLELPWEVLGRRG